MEVCESPNIQGSQTLQIIWVYKTPSNTEKYFQNLVNPIQIWIVITVSQLIWHQREFRLVPNHSENSNYNPNLVLINKIQKIFLGVNMNCSQKKRGYFAHVKVFPNRKVFVNLLGDKKARPHGWIYIDGVGASLAKLLVYFGDTIGEVTLEEDFVIYHVLVSWFDVVLLLQGKKFKQIKVLPQRFMF